MSATMVTCPFRTIPQPTLPRNTNKEEVLNPTMEQLKIIHYVFHWRDGRVGLTHYYESIDPDTVFIDIHGIMNPSKFTVTLYT